MEAPFGSWGTQTFIMGLCVKSLITSWVIKGAMDGETFAADLAQVLVPALKRGTVVLLPSHRFVAHNDGLAMGNPTTHKNTAVTEAMRWFLFLPRTALSRTRLGWHIQTQSASAQDWRETIHRCLGYHRYYLRPLRSGRVRERRQGCRIRVQWQVGGFSCSNPSGRCAAEVKTEHRQR